MKKVLTFCAAFAAAALFADGIALIELNGRHSGEKFAELKSETMNLTKQKAEEGKGDFYYFRTPGNVPAEWTTYSFSFVPDSRGIIFGFRSNSKNQWIDYDDVKVEGASLYNTSFEIVNDDNEIDGWRYYAPKSLKAGMKDAAEGSNYVTCSSQQGMRQGLVLTPGQKVTVTFKARAGKAIEVPAEKWASSGKRKIR